MSDNYDAMKKQMANATAYMLLMLGQHFKDAQARGEKPDIIGAIDAYMPMAILRFTWDCPPTLIAWMRTQKARVDELARAMDEDPAIDAFVDDALKNSKFAPKKRKPAQ